MRSPDRTNPTPNTAASEHRAAGEAPVSRERALIMAALNQVERASTWTSQRGSDAPGTVSPDAPTAAESTHPSLPREIPLPGPDTFPGYEIRREIHRGGQGVVYLANQLNTKRRVAIKVMHGGSTLGSTGRARFDREVQLLGQINHPHVVKLHDSGSTTDGSLFCVMDYVSGKPLDEILREQRRDANRERSTTARTKARDPAAGDIDETLVFFAKICDGVNAAHLKGVVHRDIKPANVRVDQNGEPVLVDFGLAKVAAGVETDLDPSSPMTMTGQFIGSLPWASPEQAVGSADAIDIRTDVYSLGVMLYQMLTGGRFPYTVIGNMRDVLDNIQRVEPARPSTIRRQINNEVETIVLKSLAKERDRRYQSAGELARDIRRYLAGEPIEAKRDAGWYVVRKTLNRHRFAVATAAGFAGMIIAGSITTTTLWRQSEHNRAIAVTERDRAEDNLDAVRDLAGTFLYRFSDSIENLRGATEARGIVLEKALEYLAILAAQPNPDDAALLALADAHDRVGDLAGGMYAASTGTTADALEHYRAAYEIRLAVANRSPQGVAPMLAQSLINLAEARFKNADFAGAAAGFSDALEQAVLAGDEQLAREAAIRRADTHRRIAQDQQDPSARRASLDAADKGYAAVLDALATRNDAPALRDTGRVLGKLSQLRVLQGTGANAEQIGPDASLALIAAGAELAERAASVAESLLAQHPADYDLARDLWLYRHHQGQSHAEAAALLDRAGRADQATAERQTALDAFARCESLARALAADESNLEALRDLALTMNKVGNTLLALGEPDRARVVYADNADLWRAVVATDPVPRHLRDLGVGAYKLGQVDEARAAREPAGPGRRALLELAANGYRESAEVFRRYQSQGGPGSGLAEQAEQDLARVRDRIAAETDPIP